MLKEIDTEKLSDAHQIIRSARAAVDGGTISKEHILQMLDRTDDLLMDFTLMIHRRE